ncbi:MAG: membrane protein insertase YidC [Pseudomonadota bacterium]
MAVWTMWTQFLETSVAFIALNLGVSHAVAIIVLTLIARATLMPVSLASAWRMQLNKEAMARLKPELDALRDRLKDDAAALTRETMALYRANGITVIDRVTFLNIGTQGVFGIGIYQALSRMPFGSKFLWIADLAKPDLWLTVLVGALMMLGMALMPGATHDASMLPMLAIAVAVSVFAVAALPSALGIYWATSNAVTVLQTLALRVMLARRRNPFAT